MTGITIDKPGSGGTLQLDTFTYDALARRSLRSIEGGVSTLSYAYEADSALDVLDIDLLNTANDVIYNFDYTLANQMSLRDISNVAYAYGGSDYLAAKINQAKEILLPK